MSAATATTTSSHPSSPKRATTPLGVFVRINRLTAGLPHNEWMLTLADDTEIVVGDLDGAPNSCHVEKAEAVVPDRSYLGKRAVRLIAHFVKGDGKWRLLTVDFGVEARRYGSEFLMCFAFVSLGSTLSEFSPYFEVGFSAVPRSDAGKPMFTLSLKAVRGIPSPCH